MDWVGFLTEHAIPYVAGGPNVRRNNIAIKCPFCGEDDPSEHLSISLVKDAWGCWRSANHCGRAPHTLIQALLGCTFPQAKLLAASYSVADPEGLSGALALLTLTSEAPRAVTGPLALPIECQPIKATGSTARFWRYLASRHFDDVGDLVSRYRLRCCLTGPHKDRVIIPLFQGGQLVGWTGRAIQHTINAPRYLSSGEAVKRMVFNEHDLREGGKILFVTEGPFDALKIDYYGEPMKVRATCIFGISMTMDQICTLAQLRRCFKKVVILLDKGAVEAAFAASDWLQAPNVVIGSLPDWLKDPGDLRREEVEQLIGGY